MCVVSMIIDHKREQWWPYTQPYQQPEIDWSQYYPKTQLPQVSPEEIAEFRRLLEKARQYDKEHDEPKCEMVNKKELLKKIAEVLEINIDFIDEE